MPALLELHARVQKEQEDMKQSIRDNPPPIEDQRRTYEKWNEHIFNVHQQSSMLETSVETLMRWRCRGTWGAMTIDLALDRILEAVERLDVSKYSTFLPTETTV